MSGIEMESNSHVQSTTNLHETQTPNVPTPMEVSYTDPNPNATAHADHTSQNVNLGEGEAESKKRKTLESRSGYWVHFDKFTCPKDKIQKARCNYCEAEIKADPRKHGTNGIRNHYNACKKAPREVPTEQMQISVQKTLLGDFDFKEGRPSLWKFDDAKVKKALCYMIIIDELPFKHVENLGFKHFLSVLCPQFNIPSRKTIARQIFQIYLDEKLKIKSFLKQSSQRVCITTDTWTSIQKINYMSLTVHFIDNAWKLQKRILCFCPITSHKGEEIGKAIERCIREWGIENIFTVTVDNASSNDVAVSYLKKRMDLWKTSLLNNEHVHMRCIAHIVNLVVQDGLKEKEEHCAIDSIRGAVRYIRSSASRFQTFTNCADFERGGSGKLLCLDVPTRWNSTYSMLEAATNLQKAFVSFEMADDNFRKDLEKAPYCGVPSDHHWERAKLLVKFLGHFYNLTKKISGSSYVTCNTVFHEISSVDLLLKEWMNSNDLELKRMAVKMKEKFDKYWGSIDKMNKIIYYAVILDPRNKLEFLEYSFDRIYGAENSEKMKREVRDGMIVMFNEYKRRYEDTSGPVSMRGNPPSGIVQSVPESISMKSATLFDEFKKFKSAGVVSEKSELDRYLLEEVEVVDANSFDLLGWWKVNVHRFPVLSKIARDILAVPVSTVASEAVFSTGGRVLDAFRSSLLPKTVQALICTQDWLRGPISSIDVEETIDDSDSIEKAFSNLTIGPSTNTN